MERILSLTGAILVFIFTTYCFKKGKVPWRFPVYEEAKKNENPVVFFFGIFLGYILALMGLLGALGFIEVKSSIF